MQPLGADSLLFLTAAEREHDLTAAKPGARLALAREDVRSINGRGASVGIRLAIFFGLAVAAVYLATWTLW